MEYRTEDQVIEESIDPAISNPRYLHPAEYARMKDDHEAGLAEERYLQERFDQEQAAPHYEAECCMCAAAVFTALDPQRHDVTCQSCRQGWKV